MKNDLKTAFSLAASYFGIIVGPAMVSGTFAVNYYSKYGLNAFWLPLLTVFISGILIYKGLEFARTTKSYDFDSIGKNLFSKYYKYIAPIFAVFMVIVGLVSLAVHYSIGASLITSLFGTSYFLSSVIIMCLILLITVFGESSTRRVNSLLFVFLVGITLLFGIIVIGKNPNFKSYSNWFENTSLSTGVLMAIAYGFANAGGTIIPVIAMSDQISSKRQSLLAAIMSVVFNYIIIILTVIITLPYCPGVLESDTPILNVLNIFNTSWLGSAYTILLLFAILSSAPSLLLGQTRRWTKVITNEEISMRTKRFIVALIISVGSCFLARYGAKSIVTTMYTVVGMISIPFLYIPFVVRKND